MSGEFFMKKYRVLFCAFCYIVSVAAFAAAPVCPVDAPLFTTEQGVKSVQNWGALLEKNSPNGSAGYKNAYEGAAYFILATYTPKAVLLPTVSHVSRVGQQSIYDYFIHFLSKNPKMTRKIIAKNLIKDGTTLSACGVGVINGYYDFALGQKSEPEKIVHGRYTMQFEYLSKPREVSVTIMDGPESGSLISYVQPIGWYIKLQNSAVVPEQNVGFLKELIKE